MQLNIFDICEKQEQKTPCTTNQSAIDSGQRDTKLSPVPESLDSITGTVTTAADGLPSEGIGIIVKTGDRVRHKIYCQGKVGVVTRLYKEVGREWADVQFEFFGWTATYPARIDTLILEDDDDNIF